MLCAMTVVAVHTAGADELQEIMPGYYVYVHTDDAPGVSSTFNSGVIVTDAGVKDLQTKLPKCRIEK